MKGFYARSPALVGPPSPALVGPPSPALVFSSTGAGRLQRRWFGHVGGFVVVSALRVVL